MSKEHDRWSEIHSSRYMLFVVTFRSFLRKHGHEHIWWHFARALGIIVALLVWMCVMPLLVLTWVHHLAPQKAEKNRGQSWTHREVTFNRLDFIRHRLVKEGQSGCLESRHLLFWREHALGLERHFRCFLYNFYHIWQVLLTLDFLQNYSSGITFFITLYPNKVRL